MIRRLFIPLSIGAMHVRHGGQDSGIPLLLAHGGPGSSASLLPLIESLAIVRPVIAPDMLGHGDSDAPPGSKTSIDFYARCLLELLDAMSIPQVDAYGHHTGAQVVAALAVIAPTRVRRVVLDGVALFSAADRAEFLDRYAPPIQPNANGQHLEWTWTFVSELTRHFPYYHADEAHALRPMINRPPDALTDACVDLLKGWRTYHLAYAAAFRDDVERRLRQVVQPTLVLSTVGDPLAQYAARAAALLAQGSLSEIQRQDRGVVLANHCAGL